MASPSSKKQRRSNEGETQTLNQLRTLGEQLLSSRAHVNNLPRLLSFLSPSSPRQFVLESLLTLQSFFVTLLPEIQSSYSRQRLPALELPRKDGEDPEAVYRLWLRSRFDDFVNSLIQLAVCPQTEETIRVRRQNLLCSGSSNLMPLLPLLKVGRSIIVDAAFSCINCSLVDIISSIMFFIIFSFFYFCKLFRM